MPILNHFSSLCLCHSRGNNIQTQQKIGSSSASVWIQTFPFSLGCSRDAAQIYSLLDRALTNKNPSAVHYSGIKCPVTMLPPFRTFQVGLWLLSELQPVSELLSHRGLLLENNVIDFVLFPSSARKELQEYTGCRGWLLPEFIESDKGRDPLEAVQCVPLCSPALLPAAAQSLWGAVAVTREAPLQPRRCPAKPPSPSPRDPSLALSPDS